MKYTVNGFNQEIAIELGLDSNDLLILRWFVDFSGTQKMIKEIIAGQPYYWIKYEGVLESLPILKIKPDTLFRKLKKMVEVGVLNHYTTNKKGKYSLFGFGPNYDALISKSAHLVQLKSKESKEIHSDENPSKKSENTRIKIQTSTDENPSEYSEKNPDHIINLLKNSSDKFNQTDCQSGYKETAEEFYKNWIIDHLQKIYNELILDASAIFEPFPLKWISNIITQISTTTDYFYINKQSITAKEVLEELRDLIKPNAQDTADLINLAFETVNNGQDLINKFKYTVATLYNMVRGT